MPMICQCPGALSFSEFLSRSDIQSVPAYAIVLKGKRLWRKMFIGISDIMENKHLSFHQMARRNQAERINIAIFAFLSFYGERRLRLWDEKWLLRRKARNEISEKKTRRERNCSFKSTNKLYCRNRIELVDINFIESLWRWRVYCLLFAWEDTICHGSLLVAIANCPQQTTSSIYTTFDNDAITLIEIWEEAQYITN